jgi:electron transfer flavoprotein alpha subunit
MSGVLVVAEARRGALQEITRELVGAANEVADAVGGGVAVLLVDPQPESVAEQVMLDGVTEVVTALSPREHFEPHLSQVAIEAAVEEFEPRIVLLGHTIDSLGLGPALAAANGFGFASDVTRLATEGGEVIAHRGFYGGKLEGELVFPDAETIVLMLRAGAFEAASESVNARVRALGVDLTEAGQTEHLGFEEAATSDVDITGADLLLSIGRGVEEAEEIPRFEQLATRMGGTLSASRPLVDNGWVPSSRQVGQSGKTVKPKVYLALGISGAVQHLAGMRGAETIIAVNTDPTAPIFGAAHFGVVADLFEIADELEQQFEH